MKLFSLNKKNIFFQEGVRKRVKNKTAVENTRNVIFLIQCLILYDTIIKEYNLI